MIAVFLPSFPFRAYEAPFLWVYFKFLQSAREPCLFLVGKDYLKDIQAWNDDERWEVSEAAQAQFGYELPSFEVLSKHKFEVIDEESLFSYSLKMNYNNNLVFKKFLTDKIDGLYKDIKSNLANHIDVEAVLTWCNCPSLSIAANELDIPVIHLELGPMREPAFRSTGYFDFRGVNGNTEAEYRYLNEGVGLKCSIEMSDLYDYFSRNNRIGHVADNSSPFCFGVPLQVDDDSNIIAFSGEFTNQSLVTHALTKAEKKPILVRQHPGGGFRPNTSKLISIDDSPNVFHFLTQCERVITINSSVGFEALLMGKEACVLGDSSFKFITNSCEEEERVRRTAFFLFGYLVPFHLLFDFNYIRFRLNAPSLSDIVSRHVSEYSMHDDCVDNTGNTGKLIEDAMAFSLKKSLLEEKATSIKKDIIINELQQIITRLEDEGFVLRDTINVLNSNAISSQDRILAYAKELERKNMEVCEMHTSSSWRLTAPLRALKRLLS